MTGANTSPQDGRLDPDYEHRLAKQAAVAALVAVQQTRTADQPSGGVVGTGDDGLARGAGGRSSGFASPARAARRPMPAGTWARRA